MKISSFKELFNEIFYDWGMSTNPQLNKYNDSFWINKTALGRNVNGVPFLTYKMSEYTIQENVYVKFLEFFENYNGDVEFESFLTIISDEWFSETFRKIREDEYTIGRFRLFKKDLKYFVTSDVGPQEINKIMFIKLRNFIEECL